MKPATFALLLGATFLFLKKNAENKGESNQPMTNLVLSDVENQGMATPSGNLAFSAQNVIQANIAQRAIDEGWTTEQTLAALQPDYIDPTVIPERQTLVNASDAALIEQIKALEHRGGTYDISHAKAIQAYVDDITDVIVPYRTPGSGSAGLELERMHPEVFGVALHY